jgi:putative membrane protein
MAGRRVHVAVLAGALAGLGLGIALVAWYGAGAVLKSLETVGWRGLGAIVAVHLVLMALCGVGWWVLLPEEGRVGILIATAARLLRDAGSELLPISPAGGAVIGARGLVLAQVPLAIAFATSVVDITLELFGQLLFTALGVALLLNGGWAPQVGETALIGLAVGLAAAIGFVVAQRAGMFLLLEGLTNRIARRELGQKESGRVHEAIAACYRRGRACLAAFLWHLAAWFTSVAEAWVALAFLGAHLTLPRIVVLESLIYALRSAAFFVPSGWGVQEGGYVLLGAFIGLPPDMALALSLAKRARELAIGLPVLAIWQALEARLLRRGSKILS